MLNLPKGQAFCLLEGGKLYKLRMPLPQVEHKRLSVHSAEFDGWELMGQLSFTTRRKKSWLNMQNMQNMQKIKKMIYWYNRLTQRIFFNTGGLV